MIKLNNNSEYFNSISIQKILGYKKILNNKLKIMDLKEKFIDNQINVKNSKIKNLITG